MGEDRRGFTPARHLLRRGSRLYFRLAIPRDLLRFFDGRLELRRSLKTTCYNDAKTLCRSEVFRAERLYMQLRGGFMTQEEMRKKTHPERYWVPLLGLYTGARHNELCQLYTEDIREEEGIACIDINEKEDKKTKTASSRRLVPVHPILIELGFKEYVDALRAAGEPRLWPALKKKRDGYGSDLGKWYQRFNRKFVTTEKLRVFHSMRHTLANELKQRGVDGNIIEEILGHSLGSMSLGRYGKAFGPKVL